jgi:dienelactone hydrolase
MTASLTDLLAARITRAYDVSSDGRVLVGHDGTGTVQLYEIAPGGAWTQLTDLGEDCRGRYLAGERAVVVEHDTGGTERYQLSVLRLDDPAAELTPLVRDEAHIHHLVDVLPGRIVYTTNRRDGVDFDVVTRDLADGSERVLYDGGGYVDEVAVSPDQRYVVLGRPAEPANSTQLVLVDTASGAVSALTPAGELAIYGRLAWAPDSLSFTFATNSGREFTGIARYDVAARGWRYLHTDEEWDLAGWPSPDGTRLLVVRGVDGAHELTLDGERVALPHAGVLARMTEPVWAPDGSRLAFTFSSPAEPGDVWVCAPAPGGAAAGGVGSGGVGSGGAGSGGAGSGGAGSGAGAAGGAAWELRRLSDSAPDLDREALIFPEIHRVPTPDGQTIPCFLYRTAGCDGSAVLTVHGGPEAQATRTWQPLVQALAAQGHAVLVPNVRGSTGYGKAWYSADDVRRRLDSVADLAALHAWLPSIGLDPARVALHGGSYGGYMVLAGLTMHPGLWAAGVDIVGISSLVTFLENTSAYRRAHREREYGSLADDRDFLVKASPITYIDQLRAPLLILHGANDPRVPLSEAEQIAAAVRARGVECELVVYADEGHGFAKQHNIFDSQPRIAAFLGRHLAAAR